MKQNNTIYYTTKEVMKLLKVSRSTLHRWRKEKKVKSKKIGGSIRFTIDDIQKAVR